MGCGSWGCCFRGGGFDAFSADVREQETIVLAIIEGALEFRDAQGKVTFVENWQTLLKRCHDFCAKEGIAPVDITSFERSSH
jgi:hypothetical protein